MRDQETRQELAEFIRHRRQTLSPEAMGFPPGRSRRTPGLRREEVAAVAGVGLTWYTALEQAKPIQVSAAFLENLAQALRLSEAERRHLFMLAHHRLPPAREGGSAGASPAALQPLLDAIAAPAYARTARFDVLAWNRANTEMFGDFARVPEAARNVLRLFFTRSYHRRSMPDWESDARALVANFRLQAAQAEDAAPFRSLAAELAAASPEFHRLWSGQEVAEIGEGVTRFLSPRRGAQRFRHHLLRPDAAPGVTIIVYLPAD